MSSLHPSKWAEALKRRRCSSGWGTQQDKVSLELQEKVSLGRGFGFREGRKACRHQPSALTGQIPDYFISVWRRQTTPIELGSGLWTAVFGAKGAQLRPQEGPALRIFNCGLAASHN